VTGVSSNINAIKLVGSRATLDFPISSGDWLKAWEQAQAGAYMEVLVPLPGDVEYAKAVERIREARGLIHGDKAEDAVSKARLAIEPVRRAYKTAAAAARALKKENKRDRDKDERWALLVENLFDLTSGAVHRAFRVDTRGGRSRGGSDRWAARPVRCRPSGQRPGRVGAARWSWGTEPCRSP
jgi:hypothetical protein